MNIVVKRTIVVTTKRLSRTIKTFINGFKTAVKKRCEETDAKS